MSSATVAKWPRERTFPSQETFRLWIGRVAAPDPSPKENSRIHRTLQPIAVEAQLCLGANAALADALSSQPGELHDVIPAAAERVSECLQMAMLEDQKLVRGLATQVLTPVDVEDIFQLSRLFVRGIERLAVVASTLAFTQAAEPGLHSIHDIVGRGLSTTADSLAHLNDRARMQSRVLELVSHQREIRVIHRRHFASRMARASSAEQTLATIAARRSYQDLSDFFASVPALLYRTALKNS